MKGNTYDRKFVKQLLQNPEEAIKVFNLIYVNDHQLSIARERKGKSFRYLFKNQPLQNSTHVERIESLVIPPAWNNVKIAYTPNGHLQATGRDAKNRKQYRYHPIWNKIRNQTKFYKMIAFSDALPKIRKQTTIDIAQDGWPQTKVLALIIKLLEESHIRIGNSYYARRNKTYGLSTLRTKHVDVYKDTIKFDFIGKKGKHNSVTIRNKKLAKLVNKCEELPGWDLFQYFDEFGEKRKVDSTMVNDYIHSICGELFSAKDFRTWAASIIVFEALRNAPVVKTLKDKEKEIIKAIDEAASELNNTRNVCRKYYVHPMIISSYMDDSIHEYFEKADNFSASEKGNLPNERAFVLLIKNYEITLD